MGFIARQRGLRVEAEAALLDYQALAQRLTQLDPDKPEWRIEVAYGHENLGVLQLDTGRAAAAVASFDLSLQAWQNVVALRPAMVYEQANTLGWASKAHQALGDYAAALATQQAKFAALERVPDAPRNREVHYLAAVAHHDIARLQGAQGQIDAEWGSLHLSQRLFRVLVDLDPQNGDWTAGLATVTAQMAELRLGTPEGAAALAECQRLVSPLLAASERKVRWRLVLQGRLLALRVRAGLPGATPVLQAWLTEVAAFEAAGHKLDAEQALIAAAAGLALGDALHRTAPVDLSSPAAQAWRLAQARLQSDGQQQRGPATTLAARLAWRLGAAQEARAGAEKLASSPYRHRDVLALRDELLQRPAPGR